MTFLERFEHMQRIASQQGAHVYDICFRRAGVGIKWFEERRAPGWNPCNFGDFRPGLVVYGYQPDLTQAVCFELRRLSTCAPYPAPVECATPSDPDTQTLEQCLVDERGAGEGE
jgi:hypothetical protein